MTQRSRTITVLIAEDDHEDCLLVRDAFMENGLTCDLVNVHDGIQLLHYLRREAGYVTFTDAPRPDLILLDLKLPRMDGFEALAEIKSDPRLRSIPVVVLTNSTTEQDILRVYDLGASGFIIKPETFSDLLKVVNSIHHYWFEVVELTNGKRVLSLRSNGSIAYTLD